MGDQQFPHAQPFNLSANVRLSDSMMGMPFYNQPQRVAPGTAPPPPLISSHCFLPEPAQLYYRQVIPSQYLCMNMAEHPMAGQVSVPPRDFSHMGVSPQAFHTLGYPNMAPQAAPVSNQISQTAVTRPAMATREKKVLEIFNPETRTPVDLFSDSDTSKVTRSPQTSEESPSAQNAGEYSVRRPQSVRPLIPLEELRDATKKVDLVKEQVQEENDRPVDEHESSHDELEQVASDSEVPAHESSAIRLLGETTDQGSSAVSEEEEEYEVGRKIYDREFLLKCKASPITRYPPEDFQHIQLSEPFRRKNMRNMGRPGQRIIKLNTAIIVKRVEGAFVPSHLQRANGELDHHKLLSRELNIILNRLSDANLADTVRDVRNMDFKSPEDLQLLAKLVFQKAICQSKYCKIFANLCKQLKGLTVPGTNETLEGLVIQQSYELFNTPLETLIAELNAVIDSKIEAAKDESVKNILSEDRETNILKKTEAYHGNIAFLAELYLCRLLSPKSMSQCLRKLKDSVAPEAITSILTLLTACGHDLELNFKSQLNECFVKLKACANSEKTPAHQSFKIRELCELRERGWKKLDSNQQPPSSAEVPARRPTEEKSRKSQTVDNKRKSNQASNQITPTSLAVSQQSYKSGKLGPCANNWQQGSGMFHKSSSESRAQLPIAVDRSREASPCIPVSQAWTGLKSLHAKPPEDYFKVLERNRGTGRKIVDMLRLGEQNAGPIMSELEDMDRSAVLHVVFEIAMEKDEKLRNNIGSFILTLLTRNQISPPTLDMGCKMFFDQCDESFLEDYPKGWEYIAQIFHHLIQKEHDYFPTLIYVLRHLKSNCRGAIVLAHCLRLSASVIGEDVVAQKWRALKLDWGRLGVTGDVRQFAEKHMVVFTVSSNSSPMKSLLELCKNPSTTLEQFITFFKQLSEVPPTLIRQCAALMITNSTGISRPAIDHRVLGLSILVDHKPEREAEVVQALAECSSHASVDQWRNSFLDKGVISSEALRTSSDCLTKSLLHNS